ncbi:hypothetical protein ABVB72_04440 [Rhizobium nepotum]
MTDRIACINPNCRRTAAQLDHIDEYAGRKLLTRYRGSNVT